MVKINREKIIKALQEKRNSSMEEYSIICDVLENHSIIGRRNKEKIIHDFIENLSLSYEEANFLYNDCMEILIKFLKF